MHRSIGLRNGRYTNIRHAINDSLTIYECNDVLRHLELPLLARWIEIS